MQLNRSGRPLLATARWRRAMITCGLALAAAAMLVLLRSSPHIASFVAVALAAVAAPQIAWSTGKLRKRVLYAAIATLLVFAAVDAEIAILLRPSVTIDGRPSSLIVRDALLGYRPRPNSQAVLELDRFGKVVYRAAYTIDSNGFRATRGAEGPTADTVVFLGDSYTFGDALADQDTLPQQVSAALGYRDRVINAAFSGYGTHQVLRLMQSGRLDPLVGTGRRTFVYLAIDEHLRRIDGRAPGDWLGTPHYVLAGDAAHFVGPYYPGLAGQWMRLMSESALAVAIGNSLMVEPTAQPTQLFGAMTGEAQQIVRKRYQGRFLMLLWDEPLLSDSRDPARARRRAALIEQMALELGRRKVDFLRVSALIPDYPAHMSDYVIAGNGHPSAQLTHRLAQALAPRL